MAVFNLLEAKIDWGSFCLTGYWAMAWFMQG